MAESLRDLVVSLSLNSDNFTRNIKSVNKQIQEAESRFKLAAAGTEGFEKSIAGLSAKSDTLQRKLKLQKDALTQYEGALAAANAKLQECYARQQDYGQRLADAKTKQAQLGQEVQRASAAYNDYKNNLGETNSATIAAKQNLDRLQEEYAQASADVQKLAGQEDALKRATQNAADAVSTAEKNVNNAKAAIKETEAQLKATNEALRKAQSAWTQAGQAMQTFGKKCKEIGSSMENVGKKLSTYVTTPIVGLGTAAVKASIEFESSFTGVRKTVDATEEQFDRLAKASKRMSTELAASTTEINSVMATGGQLGIHPENLEEFTKIMIDLGNSCEDLSADEAATSLAKFANVMQSGQDKFDEMGATLVDLGNNYATTEKAIMEMSQRLAGAGHQVGLSEAQVMGFAAALSSVGIEAQMGGSAFSKALVKMDVAVATGNEDLKSFAGICGLTTQQFKELWKSDPAGVFQSFITGLSEMNEEGISAIAVLNDIGISEIRLRDTLLRATNASELFSRTQVTANKAWKENSALTVEATKRYSTTASKLTNLKNKATLFAQTLGDDMNPTIQKMIEGVSGFIDQLMNMDEGSRKATIAVAAIAASIGPVLVVFGKLVKLTGETSEALGKFTTTIGGKFSKMGSVFTAAGGGLKGFMSVMASSPAIWVAAGVAVVAGLAKLNDYVSGAKRAREAQARLNKTVEEWKENVRTAFEDSQGLSFFGLNSSDFGVGDTGESWLERTILQWNDGKRETKETVQAVVDEFKGGSAKIRQAMQDLKDQAGGAEIGDISKDMKELDKLDKRIETLMNKRKNKNLSDKDIEELQKAIDARDALKIKYKLVTDSESAFDNIEQQVEAALSRGADTGKTYEEAYTAATQGLGSFISSLDSEYDARYKIIQAMDDAAKKEQALKDLTVWYNEEKEKATQSYYDTLLKVSEMTDPFGESGKYDETIKKLQEIQKLMDAAVGKDEESAESIALVDALSGLDEAQIVEMASAISSMKAAAQEAGIEVPESVKKAEEALLAVKTAATDTKNVFSEDAEKSLGDMFGGMDEEVHEVFATLNCDNLSQAYDAWAAGQHADIVPSLNVEQMDLSSLEKLEGHVTALNDKGQEVTLDLASLDKMKGTVTAYTDDGKAQTIELSRLKNLKGTVTAVDENGAVKTFEASALSTLNGTVITLGISPETVVPTVHVPGVIDFEEGNFSNSGNPTMEFEAAKNRETTGVFGLSLFSAEKQARNLAAFAEAINEYAKAKERANKANESGNFEEELIAEQEASAWLDGIYSSSRQFSMELTDDNGIGFKNFAQYISNGLQLLSQGKMSPEEMTEFATNYQNLLTVLNSGKIDEGALQDSGFGTFAEEMSNALQEEGWSTLPEKLTTDLETALASAKERMIAAGGDLAAGVGQGEAKYDFTPDASTMISNDEEAVRSEAESHSPAVRFNPVGQDIAAGVGQGMTLYDFSADSGLMAGNVMTSMGAALGADLLNPIGRTAIVGLAAGMTSFNIRGTATMVGTNARMALANAMPRSAFSAIGTSAMKGLVAGINAGRSGVVAAMQSAARAAVAAAKKSLKIHSPSKVFRDEVGAMTMKGFGEGVLAESKVQAKTIRNAARFLTGSAKEGALNFGSTDNSKTYNNNSNVNLTGNNFYVQDEKDIQSLAIEIASMTRRNQRGRGLRAI